MSLPKPLTYQKRIHPNSDFCCVPQCTISGKFNSAVSFHHFPKDENLRKDWIRNVRRANLVIKKATTVCSRHFLSSDIIQGGRRRVKEGAVPVLFAWNGYSLGAEGEKVAEEKQDVKLLLQCHDYDARPESSALDAAYENLDAQRLLIQELQKKVAEVTVQQSFGLDRFSASDDDIRFYTRFPSYHHLQAFWKQIEPAARTIIPAGTQASTSRGREAPDTATDQESRSLPLIDELFLFLVYLSLGLKERDLADRFNIQESSVSRIIKTWAKFLYNLLGAVGIWMSPKKIKASMPSVFGKFSNTQVIIDCTEVRCQTSSSLRLRSEMFSQHKSYTTLKGMVGVSPNGAVTFVSSLCSDSVCDKELFRQSGIIPLLDKHMAIMMNEAFSIDYPAPCKVYKLPFLGKKSQPSHNKVFITQDIVRLRIHVDRILRRIKENKVFDTVIPLSISGCINQLFVVACLLTNYQNKPLVNAWAEELY